MCTQIINNNVNRHLKLSVLYQSLRYSLLVMGLFSASGNSNSAETLEKAIMEVVVNGHSEGQQFLSFSGEDVIVSKKLLKYLHLKEEVLGAIHSESVHLNELPELTFKLETDKSVLRLTIPSAWFETQTIQREQMPVAASRKTVKQAPASAYLNYQVQSSFANKKGLEHINVPLEAGVNVGQWFGYSSFGINYDKNARRKVKLQRQMTNLTWDDPANMRSLVLGDFTPPAQLLIGSSTLGGVSWGTKFSTDRKFRPYPNLDLEAIIESASHAELISNGQTVKEWDVAPGRVLFSDLGTYAGSDAVLLLTDAYGRQRRLSIPTFTSNQLLKANLHEYNYSAGFIKNQTYPGKNFSYAHPMFSGYHRYGVNNNLTVGVALATDTRKTLVSPSMNAALGANHKFNLAGSASVSKKNNTAYAASSNYQYNWENLFGYAAFNFFGRGYDGSFVANPFNNIPPTSLEQHYQTTVGLGYNENDLGSLNANYSESVSENRKTERFVSLNYQKQLFSGLNLTLSARENLELIDDYSVLLGLRYYPIESEQREFFDALTYQFNKTNKQPFQQELAVQKYNTRGIGLGYSVAVRNDSDKNNAFGDARTQYNHEKGIITAQYSRSKTGENRGGVAVAGSVALVDGGVYTGRPVSDSFAVVKTGRENVPIELYNTTSGRTNNKGELLVPEMTSYMENKISIPANTLALNETIDNNEKYVSAKQRGGSVVTFNIQKFTAIEGNVKLLTVDNKVEKLEAVPIEIVTKEKKYEGSLGREGYFYLENIPVGEHTLTVLLYKGNCSTPIKVAESNKIVQNLGALSCKIPTMLAANQAPVKQSPSAPIVSADEQATLEIDKENNEVSEENPLTPIQSVSESKPNAELQSSKHYTIQLLASENQVEINRFISKYKNIAPLATFSKLKNAKKLFVVVYGAYDSDTDAKAALKKLPVDLKENNPWVIKISDMQLNPAKMPADVTVKAQPVVPPAENATTELSKKTELVTQEAKLQPSAKNYAIQVMASESQLETTRFINKYKTIAPLTTFNKVKNGKKIFVVIYGGYATDSEAKQALKQLPADLKKNNPWVIKITP